MAVPPATTALGALLRYITEERKSFQPMNVSFGLLPSLHNRLRGREKKAMMARRALADMNAWAPETEEPDASADAARRFHTRGGGMTSERAAFFDVGTNTILCLVAELAPADRSRSSTIWPESPGSAKASIERGASPPPEKQEPARHWRGYGDVAGTRGIADIFAVATSAMRDAENSREVRDRFKHEFGIEIRVITGEEEAEYSFLAAQNGLPLAGRELLVVDIGGGSTEFIRGNDAGFSGVASLPLGSVRLTERFLHSDPVNAEESAGMAAFMERELEPLAGDWLRNLPT